MTDTETGFRPDLSVVMPCLNEEANLAFCVRQAQAYLAERGLNGEILVVDNGSTDRSAAIAASCGAVVVSEPRRGYGRAPRTGLERSSGDVIILGDCDSTYDFRRLDPLYRPLAEGRADMIREVFDGISANFMEKLPFHKTQTTDNKEEEKNLL